MNKIATHWYIRWLQWGTLPHALCESLAQWRNEISETTASRRRWRRRQQPQSRSTANRLCTMICRLELSLPGRRLSTPPRSCPNAKLGLHTGAELLENNEASAKLTTANGGTFTWAQLDLVANHVTARSISDWRALTWLATESGWARRNVPPFAVVSLSVSTIHISSCWRLSFSSTREPSSGAVVTEQRVRRRIQISGLNSTQLNSHDSTRREQEVRHLDYICVSLWLWWWKV